MTISAPRYIQYTCAVHSALNSAGRNKAQCNVRSAIVNPAVSIGRTHKLYGAKGETIVGGLTITEIRQTCAST